MRQALIKEVHDLNEREIELLLKDKALRDDILRYTHDMESFHVNDMLDYIEPYLYDYSIAPYDYSYIKVHDFTGFIYAVDKLNNDYSLLDDDMVKTLELAIKAADDYSNSEIYSSEYYDGLDYMSLYIKDMREYLTNEFVSILEYYDTFEKVEKESDYVNIYLENIYDRECLIDGDKITLI